MPRENASIKYKIINEIGVLSDEGNWKLELNRISWNGEETKYDLRRWAPDQKRMGKGITLSDQEMLKLCEALIKEREFLLETPQ